jgi:hypothetical protein
VLGLGLALILAAILNVVAGVLSTTVAMTIATGIVVPVGFIFVGDLQRRIAHHILVSDVIGAG